MNKNILLVIISILLISALTACLTILASCSNKPVTNSSINEATNNSIEESTIVEEEPLPANTVADALLGRHKTLTVTEDEIIILSDLGMTQKVVMNRSAVSISVTNTIAFYKVTIKDNTGLSADMTLTEEDYYKVMNWIYKN